MATIAVVGLASIAAWIALSLSNRRLLGRVKPLLKSVAYSFPFAILFAGSVDVMEQDLRTAAWTIFLPLTLVVAGWQLNKFVQGEHSRDVPLWADLAGRLKLSSGGSAPIPQDPYPALIEHMTTKRAEQFVIGETGNGPDYSAPKTNTLILGPPTCGKTTGILIPQILSAPGPVIAVTSKGGNLYRATAQTRARAGKLWHFSPTNANDVLPGTTQLRWSPIAGCDDWDVALRSARAMVDVAEVNDRGTNAKFWRTKTIQLLTPVFFAAAISGESVDWVMDVVSASPRSLGKCEQVLGDSPHPAARRGQRMFQGILRAEERTRSNVFATAETAFEGYWMLSATASSIDPNFDPVAFCKSTDTVYIQASTEDQEAVAPLVVSLLSAVAKAQFELAGQAETLGTKPPTAQLWALDELASMAPMAKLPNLSTQSSSQGVFLSCVLQDLRFAKSRWGDEGEAFMTTFGTRVAFPGITDDSTLRTIANFGGRLWHEYSTSSVDYREDGGGMSTSEHKDLIDNLTPSHVLRGMLGDHDELTGNKQIDDRRILVMRGSEIAKAWAVPYFAASPYREVVIASAEQHAGPLPRPRMTEEYLTPGLLKRWKALP